jgi:hypothetical protein
VIRTDLLASPAASARDARDLQGELTAARRKMVAESGRLAKAARQAVESGDPKRSRAYRVAFGRYQQAARRYGQLQQEVPVPTRFYLFGVFPVGKVYGVPGWFKAKALLPWWARWAVAARKVKPRKPRMENANANS